MMNEKLASVIKKIDALRKLAASTHSVSESANATATALKMMVEHQLDEATIDSEADRLEDPIDTETETILYESRRITAWKQSLASGLPDLVGCFVFLSTVRGGETHRKQSRYRIIGKVSAVKLCQYLFDFVVSEIERLADINVPSRGIRGRNPAKESFCTGAVAGFLSKMRAERKATMEQANVSAMVLVSQQANDAKLAYVAATGVRFGTAKFSSKSKMDVNQYSSGFEKGKNISVNAGLNSSSSTKPNQLF